MGDENSKGTHWVSLLIHKHLAAYFDFFGSEYISLEVLNQSDLNQLLTIYLEKKMNLLCVGFIVSVSCACRKNFVRLH